MNKSLISALLCLSLPFAYATTADNEASPLDPSTGWTAPVKEIPGIDALNTFSIQGILSSGGTTLWAYGLGKKGGGTQWRLAVFYNGNWSYYDAPNAPVNYFFVPAYPNTGARTNGWSILASDQNAVAYFTGSQFLPPDTTTFNQPARLFLLLGSQGVGWGLLQNSQNGYSISAFDTLAANPQWSALQAVPGTVLPSVVLPNPGPNEPSVAISANAGNFYLLTTQDGATKLLAVNKADQITTLCSDFHLPEAPTAGQVFAVQAKNGIHLVVIFLGQPLAMHLAHVYSYESVDGGNTWTDISSQLPRFEPLPQFNLGPILFTTFANGRVVIPTLGNDRDFDTLNLYDVHPQWAAGPAPNGSFYHITLSADGTEMCDWAAASTSSALSCWNFNATAPNWVSLAPPTGMLPNRSPIPFDQTKVALLDQTGNPQFYDGEKWVDSSAIAKELLPGYSYFNSSANPFDYWAPMNIYVWGWHIISP